MEKIVFLVFGLVASSASFAQSVDPIVSPAVAFKTKEQAIQLYIQPVASVVMVNLTDAQGHILYSVKTKLTNGFHKQFDVSALEAGSYQLHIQTAQQTIVKPFVIEDQPIKRHVTLQA